MRMFVAFTVMAGLAGCGSQVRLHEAPVNVTGNVSHAGQPVSGMLMVFQPLGDGHMREFPVQKDGTFSGELVAGEYAYFVAKPPAQLAGKIAPKYFEADISRKVAVEAGTPLVIALD